MNGTTPHQTLSITIIGAGVAGLSAALALTHAHPLNPHNITIYESNPSLSEFGAGIQLSPNATRILISQWGLKEAFLKVVNVPEILTFRRWQNGAIIGSVPHNPMAEWEYGWPWWQIFRPDLQRILYDAVVDAGVSVHFGKRVTHVNVDTAAITLADGSTVLSDLVIAGDGIHSPSRAFLPSARNIHPVAFGEHAYRTAVPRSKMHSNPITAGLMAGGRSEIWAGPGAAILGYPISAGEQYNVVVSVPSPSNAPVARWNERVNPAEVQALVQGYCEEVTALAGLVESCAKWTLAELPELAHWHSESGRFVLVGDAAHAIVPHAGQGGALAIEDSAVLALCLSQANDLAALPRALQSFQNLRKERVESIRRIAYGNAGSFGIPDGPAQEKRDQIWAAMTAKWQGELEAIGAEGIKNKPRPTPDRDAPDFTSLEAREWLYGHDVVKEAREYLAQQ